MKWSFVCLLLLVTATSVFSQSLNSKRETSLSQGEFRAAWISSVSNLDWPRPEDRNNIPAQKASLIAYLDTLQSLNMNAALLQVRPECDALYQSSYEPWSRYLTGSQGTDPGYDPLQFAIEESHKRGIELHAWLNPYRINASKSAGNDYYDNTHVYKEHPEWALAYEDGGKILNPGLPQVQNYIKEIVGDIINNYDVDGIHFDDYFYSYSGTPTALDADTYATYGGEYASLGDFRRGSINQMIEAVWDTIQSVKPYVRYGVSPFGIYGNGMNPPGISGLDAYNVIYCDPLAWLQAGKIDYVTPQLYWPTGGSQDYATLLPWWADQASTYNRHIYAGQGIYRLSNSPAAKGSTLHELKNYYNLTEGNQRVAADSWTLGQIVQQVNINRSESAKGSLGSIYFRMNDFYRVDGLYEYLKAEIYQELTLVPEMTWKASTMPDAPTNVRLAQANGQAFFSLVWDQTETGLRSVIYTVNPEEDPAAYLSDSNRKAIAYTNSFDLSQVDIPQGSAIVVTSLNRFGKESGSSAVFEVPAPVKGTLLLPVNSASDVESTDYLKWSSIPLSSRYVIEIATNNDFTENFQVLNRNDTSVQVNQIPLQGETTYYWRIAGENFGGTGGFSDIFTFTTGFPEDIDITFPSQNADNVPLQPRLQWNATTASDSVQIQISEGGNAFNANNLFKEIYLKNNSEGIHDLDQELKALTTYYLRMRSFNEFGYSNWTEVTQFKTLFPTPAAPTVSSPAEGVALTSEDVTIEWTIPATATSYLLQISLEQQFESPIVDQRVFDVAEYNFIGNLRDTTYYIRVSARNPGGFGEWSEIRSFRIIGETVTSVQGPKKSQITAFPNPVRKILTIRVDSNSETEDVQIYNAFGVLLNTQIVKVSATEYEVDLDSQQCAPCLLRVKTGGTYQTLKIVSEQ